MRIVSLLPSATEIICGLGLRDHLVGVSHECDYPADVAELPKVTQKLIPHDASSADIDTLVREQLKSNSALYSLDTTVLERLAPDLIVTQALCDVCAVADSEVQAAACALPGSPSVINLEPMSLDDVMQCIQKVGNAAERSEQADRYVSQLKMRVNDIATRSSTIEHSHRPSTVLLEWIDPPFSAGHWSPELVSIAGGDEAIGIAGERSTTTTWSEIVKVDPEVMVIACCGFNVARTMDDLPILRSYPGWSSLRCVQANRVYLVDGNAFFNRPGPRLVNSLEILANLLHPNVHPLRPGAEAAIQIEV